MRRRFHGFLLVEVITAALVVGIGLGVLVELCRQSAGADVQALGRAARELRLHGWLEVVVAQPYPVLAGFATRGEVPESALPRSGAADGERAECDVQVRAVADGLLEVRVSVPGTHLAAARLVSRSDLSGEVGSDEALP